MRIARFVTLFLLLCGSARAEPLHGIAMHGDPALPKDFKSFTYVNPTVKKGGSVRYGVVGTFDNLNPFILKSMRTTARGIVDPDYGNLVYEGLMQRSRDEAFSLYGLLAQSVEWDADRKVIQFNLNPDAKWSDGEPVTPEDVIFTFETFRDKGRAPYSSRLKKVEKMEKIGEQSVKFTLTAEADREFPLILALSPIIAKHAVNAETFDQTNITPPIGSGPYRVAEVKPGEKVRFERNPDYWGRNLPSKIGFDNYDSIIVSYYLQDATLFEAFKKGEIDIYPENNPTKWNRTYDFPAVTNGDVVKDVFEPKLPSGMYGFVFNTRKPIFADVKVRQALSLAFDFEWVNKNLLDGAYRRTQSFWQNSDLSSLGFAADDRELSLLGPIRDHIEPDILNGTYKMPVTDGSGRDRTVLKTAVDLLRSSGYGIQNGKMVDKNGAALAFEIMTQNEDQEKLALAYQRFLAAIGVAVSVRTVDDSSYQQRSQNFDYDMILKSFTSSLSPGIEQTGRWGSAARDNPGTENFAGAASPDIDAMIGKIMNARDADDFKAAVRAYDRLLLSGHYVIPLFHLGQQWVARRNYIRHPDVLPLYGYQLSTWWDARAQ
jgi:peptide/nickel transport system substrate-binding protein